MLSRHPDHSPRPSCHCAARAFSFTSFTSFASLTYSKPFTIRTCRKVGGGGHSCHSGIRHKPLVTTHYVQVLSFQTIPHSFALFCTYQKLNPFVFMQFHALCEKHPGVGEGR